MTPRTAQRTGAILLLLLFAFLGVRGVLATAVSEPTAGQRLATMLQWAYAALGMIAAGGLLAGRGGTRFVLYAWAAAFIARNALVPIVWGGKGLMLGVAGAAVGVAFAASVLYLSHLALGPARADVAP